MQANSNPRRLDHLFNVITAYGCGLMAAGINRANLRDWVFFGGIVLIITSGAAYALILARRNHLKESAKSN